jgi:3-dehydroquinate synthetase
LAKQLDLDPILSRMRADKKNEGAHTEIRFVLTPKLGELVWFQAKPEMIAQALKRLSAS